MLVDYFYRSHESTVYGFRYEGDRWQSSSPLLTPASGYGSFDDAGAMIVDASGMVVGVMGGSSPQGQAEYAFRYTPGIGWDTEIAAYAPETTAQSYLGLFSGGEVALYQNNDDTEASLYQNGIWSNLPPIPGYYLAYYVATASAPTGEMLLAEQTAANTVVATWLLP
jgi:hypothetical protein